jgi:hypothetical protein
MMYECEKPTLRLWGFAVTYGFEELEHYCNNGGYEVLFDEVVDFFKDPTRGGG